MANTNKQKQIVEAALRRFSHFGVAKTSMAEVADDLAITRQVLSYYFPGKESLVRAVAQSLTGEYSEVLQQEMEGAQSVEEALLKLTTVKASFFEKYFLLATGTEHLDLVKQGSLAHWKKTMTEKESALLVCLFEKGMRSGELKTLDAAKTSALLLQTLYAFSLCVRDKGVLPDVAAFSEVLEKQQEVIRLFYQGLKAGTWVN